MPSLNLRCRPMSEFSLDFKPDVLSALLFAPRPPSRMTQMFSCLFGGVSCPSVGCGSADVPRNRRLWRGHGCAG